MNFYIVIPCHNEAAFIEKTLTSMVAQTLIPKKVVVINDQSTDHSAAIISTFAKAYSFIELVTITSSDSHLPGSKIIKAFQKGFDTLDADYDIICKYDADLEFPTNYLEKIATHFERDSKIGLAGGFCYVEHQGDWVLENLTNQDHVRGALKAYRRECFNDIKGLKPAMGWDTVDELLARYHHWKVYTDPSLKVKHLKPTGNAYNRDAQYQQGAAFYGMRYGFLITFIAALKLAVRKGNLSLLKDYLQGYFRAKRSKKEYLVTEEEGIFIRKLRWKGIKSKLGLSFLT